jgi:2-polyprenyl-3-methyl-5-hydroxy-6-metoxy-1,4-benzoquinol methylase
MSPDRPMIDQLRADTQAELRALEHGPRRIHAHVMRPIMRQLNRAEAHTVLDLGCGDGWFTGALDRCGFDVVGVDHDPEMLALAKLKYPQLRFHAADAMQPLAALPMARFDAVVAIDLIDHVTHPRKVIATALEVLRPGGVLVLTVPYYGYVKNIALALAGRFDARWDPLLDGGRIKFFSRRTLLMLLREFGLEDMHIETVGRLSPIARAMLSSARANRSNR